MSAAYVRQHYGVDFKRGDRVVHEDRHGARHGVIVSFPRQYVGVRFDGYAATAWAHPLELTHERAWREAAVSAYIDGEGGAR